MRRRAHTHGSVRKRGPATPCGGGGNGARQGYAWTRAPGDRRVDYRWRRAGNCRSRGVAATAAAQPGWRRLPLHAGGPCNGRRPMPWNRRMAGHGLRNGRAPAGGGLRAGASRMPADPATRRSRPANPNFPTVGLAGRRREGLIGMCRPPRFRRRDGYACAGRPEPPVSAKAAPLPPEGRIRMRRAERPECGRRGQDPRRRSAAR